jgi:hypothetical protein
MKLQQNQYKMKSNNTDRIGWTIWTELHEIIPKEITQIKPGARQLLKQTLEKRDGHFTDHEEMEKKASFEFI